MRPALGATLLLLVTACIYAPTVRYGFVYEDRNDLERFLSPPAGLLATVQTMRLFPSRSVTGISYDLSKRISGAEPWGFHLVSVGLHLLNSALLYLLARRVLAPWAAVMALALFALHPIQVEAVAYISARADVLMTTAILCALLAVEGQRWGLALVACIAAVLAKELGIVVFPLVGLWVLWRGLSVPRWVLGSVLAVKVAALALFVSMRYTPITLDLTYTGTELVKAYALLSKLVIPIGFSIDHDWRAITPVLAAFGLALTGFLVGCASLVPRSMFAFSTAWVLVCLLPRISVPLLEGLHEHHTYSWLVGLSLAGGHLLTVGVERYGISEALPQA